MNIVQQSFKRLHYPVDVILLCLRWYLSYNLSLRNLEQMMYERGIILDHSTVGRWVLRLSPLVSERIKNNKPRYCGSWRMDETYIKVKGRSMYLFCALDKHGNTVDFMLSEKRDKPAAIAFFSKAIASNAVPTKVNIDKSGSNLAALEHLNTQLNQPIQIRQCKYLNNIIEQDHRFIKKRCKPMLGFKTFNSANITLQAIESMHISHKKQIKIGNQTLNVVDSFYQLVA